MKLFMSFVKHSIHGKSLFLHDDDDNDDVEDDDHDRYDDDDYIARAAGQCRTGSALLST